MLRTAKITIWGLKHDFGKIMPLQANLFLKKDGEKQLRISMRETQIFGSDPAVASTGAAASAATVCIHYVIIWGREVWYMIR